MTKLKCILSIAMLIPIALMSQTEEDALRYSYINFGGTARYCGVAGAFGSLGADLSVLSTNPAGMARYKSSEFSFTPQIQLENSSATFMNNTKTNGRESLVISNIGIVGVVKAGQESSSLWRSIQFGFAYNRLADFNERSSISGISDTSMSYVFAAMANGTHPDDIYTSLPFTSGLAYDTYVIDPGDSMGSFYTTQLYEGDFDHSHTIVRKGSVNETAISMSGNYNGKLYIGGTVGFPKIKFDQQKSHSETTLSDSLDIDYFQYSENLSTRGNGINLKVGLVVLPFKWLRIGAAYHTPTRYYYMKDNWNTQMSSSFKNGDEYTSTSPDGSFLYKLKTPGRIIGSISFIITKRGMISADYEYVDYTGSALSSHPFSGSNYSFSNENETGDINFRATHNLRIGSEYRVKGPLFIRAGTAFYQNPYKPNITENNTAKLTISGGFGYRVKSFYADFAFTSTKSIEDYFMYDPSLVENTPISKSITNLVFTFGRKF